MHMATLFWLWASDSAATNNKINSSLDFWNCVFCSENWKSPIYKQWIAIVTWTKIIYGATQPMYAHRLYTKLSSSYKAVTLILNWIHSRYNTFLTIWWLLHKHIIWRHIFFKSFFKDLLQKLYWAEHFSTFGEEGRRWTRLNKWVTSDRFLSAMVAV